MKAQFLFLALFSSAAFAAPESFKMYEDRDAEPNEFCDVYTELKLNVDGSSGTANVRERVSGSCDLFVAPNPRSYSLVGQDDGCGSTVYTAVNGSEAQVEITDNRGRLCENVIPSLIVLKEFDVDGAELPSKYSYDN